MNMKKLLCILLTLFLLLSSCAEETEDQYSRDLAAAETDFSVIAVFRGGALRFEEVYPVYAQLRELYTTVFGEDTLDPSNDIRLISETVNSLIGEKLTEAYIQNLGVTLLTDEDIARVTEEARAEYAAMLKEYTAWCELEGYPAEDAARYLEQDGITEDGMIADCISAAKSERTVILLAGEVTVTEEDFMWYDIETEDGQPPSDEYLYTCVYEEKRYQQYQDKLNELMTEAEIVYFLDRMN